MRAAVTGVTGYVGGRLVPELLAAGHEVRALARHPERLAGRDWVGDVETVAADAGTAPASERARRRVVTGIVKDVAEELGNTPAVARSSYIDPRLFDLWERGETIGSTRSQTRAEREVLELLG